MARLVLKDIEREGVLTGEALREVRGGARVAARTGGSQTDHGRVTNDPSANNPNAHDHQTDGIHDDNGRIGNNGLGRQGRSGGSTGGSAARPTGGGSASASRIKWNATVLLAEKPKTLPRGQVAASEVKFEETVSKYVSGNVNVEVVRSVTLSSGADSKVRDAFTFTRKGGVKGYGIELDTAVERNKGYQYKSSTSYNYDYADDWRSGSSSYSTTYSAGNLWVDAGTGAEKWIEGTKSSYGSSTSWSYKTVETGKTVTTYYDPLALDLDGDRHVSTSGVGAYKTQSGGYNVSNDFSYTSRSVVSRNNATYAKGTETVTLWDGSTTTAQAGRLIQTGREVLNEYEYNSSYHSTWETKAGQKGYVMDFNTDRKKDEAISFATGGDAYLAVDRDGDGLITKGTELFGPSTNNGLKELAAFDSNKDGKISKLDKAFGSLKLTRIELKNFTYGYSGEYSYDAAGRYLGGKYAYSGSVPNSRNFQALEYKMNDYKYEQTGVYGRTAYSVKYSGSYTYTGYVQKVWSLADEGIEELNLSTLSRARAEFDGTGVSASTSTADEAQARNLLREARTRTGIDTTGARVIMTREDGGAATQTTNVAQTFQAAQPATGLSTSTSTGGRGARDTTKRA